MVLVAVIVACSICLNLNLSFQNCQQARKHLSAPPTDRDVVLLALQHWLPTRPHQMPLQRCKQCWASLCSLKVAEPQLV